MTPEQEQQFKLVAQAIIDLSEHPAWIHYQRVLQKAIQLHSPNALALKASLAGKKLTPELATQTGIDIASQLQYVAGLEKALSIPLEYRQQLIQLNQGAGNDDAASNPFGI
jgi:hypothetical protein